MVPSHHLPVTENDSRIIVCQCIQDRDSENYPLVFNDYNTQIFNRSPVNLGLIIKVNAYHLSIG